MKILLAGVALAIALAFSSQAFALPYCANSASQQGQYGCTSFDK